MQSSTTIPLLFSAEARFEIGFGIDFDRNCFFDIMSEFRPSIKSTWGEARKELIEGYGPRGRRFIIRAKVDCVRMAVMIWNLQVLGSISLLNRTSRFILVKGLSLGHSRFSVSRFLFFFFFAIRHHFPHCVRRRCHVGLCRNVGPYTPPPPSPPISSPSSP